MGIVLVFKEQLIASLQKSGSTENLEGLGRLIVKNKIPLASLLDTLNEPKPVPMRFMWMVGGLCALDPKIVFPCVEKFYLKRTEITFPNYDRSLAKMFLLAGIPENLEAEIINELFKWLLNPKVSVSTKYYSLWTLYTLCSKYPELKIELKTVIEDQLDKNTQSWRKQALNILNKIS